MCKRCHYNDKPPTQFFFQFGLIQVNSQWACGNNKGFPPNLAFERENEGVKSHVKVYLNEALFGDRFCVLYNFSFEDYDIIIHLIFSLRRRK